MAIVKVLVIGASQAKYFESYLRQSSNLEVTVNAVSGRKVEDVVVESLSKVKEANHIILHLGTNNVPVEGPAATVKRMEKLLMKIRRWNPDCAVYVSSILPRATSVFPGRRRTREEIEDLNDRAITLNVLYQSLVFRFQNCHFIDNSVLFMEGGTAKRHLLSRDGLHLTPHGIRTLLGNMLSCLIVAQPYLPTSVPPSPAAFWPLPRCSPTTTPPVSPVTAPSGCFSYRDALISSPAVPFPSLTLSSSSSRSGKSETPLLQPSFSTIKTSKPEFSYQHHLKCKNVPCKSTPSPSALFASRVPPTQSLTKPVPLSVFSQGNPGLRKSLSSSARASRSKRSSQNCATSSLSVYSIPLHNKYSFLQSSAKSVPSKSFIPPGNLRHKSKLKVIHPHHQFIRAVIPSYRPVNGGGRAPIVYPRLCDNCCKTYQTKQSFSNHKKNCTSNAPKGPSTASDESVSLFPDPTLSPNNFVPKEGNVSVIMCPTCKKTFVKGENLKKHSKICQRVKKYPRLCKDCSRMYKSKESYHLHKKNCDRLKLKSSEGTFPPSCSTCHALFSNKHSFQKHMKVNCEDFSVKCTFNDCNRLFRSNKSMMYHLTSHHSKEATKFLTFNNFNDFKEWKKTEERQSFCNQRKICGTIVFKEETIHYYKCLFNRKKRCLQSVKQQRRTARKRRYGQIPEGACPSGITARVTASGEVKVKYVSCHSHSIDKKNRIFHRWQPETIAEVKRLLNDGVSAENIRLKFCKKKGENIPYPLREHYMTTREILRYKFLLKRAKRKDDDDATAVKKKVDSMTEEEKKNILIYKPQGCPTYIGDANFDSLPYHKDLFVYGFQTEQQLKEMQEGSSRGLCIDATHKTNRYDFYLLNILIPDEYGSGLVVAQFVTNHLDAQILEILFRSIKKKCPHLPVHIVMTDDDPALWESFKSVFSEDNPNWDGKHLLCKWHILRSWQKNLNKIRRGSLRRLINKYLRVLMEERNVDDFETKLKNFLKKFSGSQYTRFIKYFKTYYLNNDKPRLWAMCYRNYYHNDIDTNNFVESFHRVLKKRLKRLSNLRMDELIEILEEMEHERFLKLEDRRVKGEPHKDFNKADARHSRGMKIRHSAITFLADNKWLIKSENKKGTLYLVTRKTDKCCLDHCYDKCNNMSCFGLCIHLYDCNCPDKVGLCKHIHRVHSFSTRNNHRSVTIVSNEDVEMTCESRLEEPELMSPECSASDVEDEPCSTHSFSNDSSTLSEHLQSNKDEVAQFDILVDELRKIMHGSNSNLRSHVLTSLRSEISFCKLNSQPKKSVTLSSSKTIAQDKKSNAQVPPMLCTFAPNQKSPCQPKMYKTIKKRKVSRKSFAKPDKEEFEALSQELLTYINDDITENNVSVVAEGNVTEVFPLAPNSLPESISFSPVLSAPSPNIVTSVITSVRSQTTRRRKGQSFSPPLTSYESATVPYRFENLHVSEVELKSLDPNISDTEVAFLKNMAEDFVKGWLYDAVIDIFLRVHGHGKQGIFTLETAFAQKILDKNASPEDILFVLPQINYKGLKKIIIPINVSHHWILIVVDNVTKKILVFDPLHQGISASYVESLSRLRSVLALMLNENVSAWAEESPKHHLQKDKVSCGVFISFYAFKIIKNEDPNMFFDVDIFRHYMYTSVKASVEVC